MAGQGEACRNCATADVLRKRIVEIEGLLREIDKKVVFETSVLDGSGPDLQERIEATLGIGRFTPPAPPRQ